MSIIRWDTNGISFRSGLSVEFKGLFASRLAPTIEMHSNVGASLLAKAAKVSLHRYRQVANAARRRLATKSSFCA
ncbi:hypothetical protein C2E19_18405 [Pseudomonas sp. DTU12.3]|nr:hypothetical protein C2E19_18405 [Pseudomonas sp. DTU12.3]